MTSVTAPGPGWTCTARKVFAFVAEGYTTWTYRFEPSGAGTKVTESYEYAPAGGAQGFFYDVVMRRPAVMVDGMRQTLERVKRSVESS